MKKTLIIAVAVLAVAAAAITVFYVTRNPKPDTRLYICPMHPQVIQDRPGSCPICGMDLVKVEKEDQSSTNNAEGEVNDRAEVFISPEKQQMIGVKTDLVSVRELGSSLNTVGVVTYDPELYYAQQEYITAYRNISEGGTAGRAALSILESAKIKLKSLGLSDEQINKLQAMDAPSKSLLLNEGGESVWVYARVYQDDLASVKRGYQAEIMSSSTGKRVFKGKVAAVDPVLNPETRTARVRIQVENAGGLLKSEMYVDVRIKSTEGKYLSIPADAVMDTGTKQIVFIDKGDGHFEPRLVVVGTKKEDYYVVQAGVSEGDRVVVNANFLIDSESQLKAALSNMGGGSTEHKH